MIAGARSDIRADALDVCRRHDLTLRAVWPARHGNSVFMARVTDAAGRDLALKQTLPGRSRSEVAALCAWQETGAAVRLHTELEADVFVMEWLDGPCLADCPVASLYILALGRMLGALHAVSPPGELLELRPRFAADVASAGALSGAMQRCFGYLSAVLYGADFGCQTLLHRW